MRVTRRVNLSSALIALLSLVFYIAVIIWAYLLLKWGLALLGRP
jgi:hypothetical protein